MDRIVCMLFSSMIQSTLSFYKFTFIYLQKIRYKHFTLNRLAAFQILFFMSQSVCSEPLVDSEYLFSLSLEDLQSVQVTVATGKPQLSVEAPGIISVITSKEIDYWGYQSVAEAIDTLPGVYCIDDGLSPNCGMRGINGGFRGYSKVFKVMINGHPVSFRSDSNNYLGSELIPINVVKRIEVIRGPASAVYGANAYLGVVNIITKHAEENSSSEVRITHDNLGNAVSLNYQLHLDTMNITASLSKASLNRSGAQVPDGLPERSEFISGTTTQEDKSRPLNWFGQVEFKLGQHLLQVDTHYSRLDSKANFVDFGRFDESGELGKNVRFSLDNWYVQLKDEWSWREDLKFNTSLAYSEGKPSDNEKLDVGLADSYPVRDFGYKAIDLVGEVLWDINDFHHITVGIDFSEDDEKLFEVFDVDRQTNIRTQRAAVQSNKTFLNTAIYTQYQGELSEQLGLTVNFRLDDHNIYGRNSSYRLGTIYKLTDAVSTKLLYGTSFKAPAAVQLYGQPLFDGEVTGNATLKEETAETFEVQLNWLLKENVSWSINAYRTLASDLVVLVPRGVNQKPENQDLQKTIGFESELLWQGEINNISANISVLESDAKSLDILGRPTTTTSELYPKFSSNIFWKHSLSSNVNIGLSWRHISPRRASKSNILLNGGEPYQRADYDLINLAVNYYYNDLLRFNLSVKNLLDENYADPGFSGVDVPGRRRNVQFTVNFNF